jgi:hypothetical protein
MNPEDGLAFKRREWLRLSSLGAAGTLLGGCSKIVQRYTAPSPPATVRLPAGDVEPTVRLLNRVAFGPTPGEVARVAKIGAASYIETQLNPDDGEENLLMLRLRGVEVLRSDAMELRDLQEHEVLRQLQQAALLRAVYSRHQLRERLVDFWSNHFNIYARKGYGAYLKSTDEVDVVRRHALGKFPDLLRASAHSPAMLAYLDNQENRRGVPNENYARELMELHTLGVHGGYTQKDVLEVARCFTGWTIENRFLRRRGNFRFDEALHDNGSKKVLGVPIPAGGGQGDATKVLEILATHPATARFIAGKLCRYFLGEDNANWTKKLSAIYAETGGDIKAMLRPLLLSAALQKAPPILKRPFDFTVSALRALNADTDGGAPLQEHLARMGQPLYQWPMPDGYPDKTAAWTGSLLARWNFALALTGGSIGSTSIDIPALLQASGGVGEAKTLDALMQIVWSRRVSDKVMQAHRDTLLMPLQSTSMMNDDPEKQKTALWNEVAALLIAAPEFQWR